MMKTMEPNALASAGNTALRSGDQFLEQDHEQLARWTGLMRRTEDLADRIAGAVPTTSGPDGSKPEQAPGFIGAAFDMQRHRDFVAERLANALDRIERVL